MTYFLKFLHETTLQKRKKRLIFKKEYAII